MDAHGVPCTDRGKRRFNGARSYKARKLAGAISEVREKYASEAQSRGSDAFHARPPEFRGILEFFSDIFRGSCFPSSQLPPSPSPPSTPVRAARPHAVSARRNVPWTRLRDVSCMYMYPPRKCLPRAFLRFIFTCGHLKVECDRNLPFREKCDAIPLWSF